MPLDRIIKVVVWDLDNTLWDGRLVETPDVKPRPGVLEVIRGLDERGVLHSVASRNDHGPAIDALHRLGLAKYFLYPQIGWGAKSASIREIAELLNLGVDSFAFVDDEPFERAEVAAAEPGVLCLDPDAGVDPKTWDSLVPRTPTRDARRRRALYLAEQDRKEAERRFDGPPEAFLASLEMTLTVGPATAEDLARAEELAARTNQLNTNPGAYREGEIGELLHSDRHRLLLARLQDRYGDYGTIASVLIEYGETVWTLKQLAVSCRAMGRGIEVVLVDCVRRLARTAGVGLCAEFRSNGRNDILRRVLLRCRFRPTAVNDETAPLQCLMSEAPAFPSHVRVSLAG
jgi:FkbH-like protein